MPSTPGVGSTDYDDVPSVLRLTLAVKNEGNDSVGRSWNLFP